LAARGIDIKPAAKLINLDTKVAAPVKPTRNVLFLDAIYPSSKKRYLISSFLTMNILSIIKNA
jgi:hypothetical protein